MKEKHKYKYNSIMDFLYPLASHPFVCVATLLLNYIKGNYEHHIIICV